MSKIILFIFLGACSHDFELTNDDRASMMDKPRTSQWFGALGSKFQLVEDDNLASTHLFWDKLPNFDEENISLDMVVTTEVNSKFHYELNLPSGKILYHHSFCPQKDVFSKYSGALANPPITVGFVPGFLDKLGNPLRIYLLDANRPKRAEVVRVRLVGALVESFCYRGDCRDQAVWPSSLSLLAVETSQWGEDSLFYNSNWPSKSQWTYWKAWIENFMGRNYLGDISYAHKRVSDPIIETNKIIMSVKKYSQYFKPENMRSVQKNCQKLYSHLNKEVNIEGIKKNAQSFRDNFIKFNEKYFDEFKTCLKFIHHGNVKSDTDRFWFLNKMSLFYYLNLEGNFFDCPNRNWQLNRVTKTGMRMFNIKTDLKQCRASDLNAAFEYIPSYLNNLKKQGDYFYRFVDYDSGSYGSHQRAFSWMRMKKTRLECSYDPNPKIMTEMDNYPQELRKRFEFNDVSRKNDEYIR